MTTPLNEILIGDVRQQLALLDAGSVHCVVTSPPYWGLRAYGTDPQVWGGAPDCDHDWLGGKKPAKSGEDGRSSNLHIGSGTCSRCNAWRGELGSEPTTEQFVANMVDVFSAVHRVLRDDGTCWINIGDCYSAGTRDSKSFRRDRAECCPARGGHMGKQTANTEYPAATPNRLGCGIRPKNLVGIPWRLAFALQSWGWYLRSEIVWHKPNAMPFSVTDRPSTNHELIFLLSKKPRYFFDHIAVQEPAIGGSPGNKTHKHTTAYQNGDERHRVKAGLCNMTAVETRNLRTVWRIPSSPYKGAHFATFPPRLVEPCIKAGTSERGVCPGCGSPWVRTIKRERVPTRPGTASKILRGGHAVDRESGELVECFNKPWAANGVEVGNRDPMRHITRTVTTGWQPSCKCAAAEPVPAIVLDPFLGSGTTALMAEHLGRHWLGIDLNAGYAEQARERIAAGYTPPKAKRPRIRRLRKQLMLMLETLDTP